MTAHEVFLQQLINGFTTGSYLALIALGYTMVYGIIELINFAHGDIYALGFFISLSLLTWLGITSTLTGGQLLWTIPGVMLLTMLATGLANMSVDRIAYRPLRHAPRLAPLITAIGASFALENIMQNWYGPGQIYYYNIFPTINLAPALLGPQSEVLFTTKDVFLVAVTIPLMVGLTLFVKHTKMGKAMRATAQDREAAAMMGINIERVIMTTFFIGGALAGAAGMVVGIYLNTGRYLMGFDAGLQAFTAAVVGGIGNIPGAVLGAYLIGCLSALSDQYLSAAWTRATVFALLILFLVFRPSGILGEQIPEKF
ncbi:MAG: branched-chain amino acid ABC transporter permease [Candidatus Methylomirabilales bacterium]